MSPLWGFGCLVYPVFYKHVAPLGLKTRFLVFQSSAFFAVMGWIHYALGFTRYSHVAPLGLWVFGVSRVL